MLCRCVYWVVDNTFESACKFLPRLSTQDGNETPSWGFLVQLME